MKPGYVLHAVDRCIDIRKKTITTVCGLRVSTSRVFASGDLVNCVGCRAILEERKRDAVHPQDTSPCCGKPLRPVYSAHLTTYRCSACGMEHRKT